MAKEVNQELVEYKFEEMAKKLDEHNKKHEEHLDQIWSELRAIANSIASNYTKKEIETALSQKADKSNSWAEKSLVWVGGITGAMIITALLSLVLMPEEARAMISLLLKHFIS